MPPQPVIAVLPPSSVSVLIQGRNDDPIISSPPRPATAATHRRVACRADGMARMTSTVPIDHVDRGPAGGSGAYSIRTAQSSTYWA
ncbi:MAG TPA: hypothetical protein VII33_12670, partial [Nakamurella sp.]